MILRLPWKEQFGKTAKSIRDLIGYNITDKIR